MEERHLLNIWLAYCSLMRELQPRDAYYNSLVRANGSYTDFSCFLSFFFRSAILSFYFIVYRFCVCILYVQGSIVQFILASSLLLLVLKRLRNSRERAVHFSLPWVLRTKLTYLFPFFTGYCQLFVFTLFFIFLLCIILPLLQVVYFVRVYLLVVVVVAVVFHYF